MYGSIAWWAWAKEAFFSGGAFAGCEASSQ
jgi:hypothetical protein